MKVNAILIFLASFLLSFFCVFGTEESVNGTNWYTVSRVFETKPSIQNNSSIDDQQSYTGKNRIELEENLVNGINLLTQSMLSQENTIYVIKYDFDLNHNVSGIVAVPANCILLFEGGSIGNGTIIGEDTEIQAGLVKIFDTNVTLAGSWKNNGHIRWFGANPNNRDNTAAIQKCFDCFELVEIDNAAYRTNALNMTKCRVLKGIKAPRGEMSTLSFVFDSSSKSGLKVIYQNSYPYVEIEGISFVLNDKESLAAGSIAIDLSASTSGAPKHYSVPIKCNGCVFKNFEIGIKSNYKSYYNYIDDCVFTEVSQCLRDFSSNNLIITKTCAFYFTHFAYGIVGNGPFILRECSFELYTGGIVFSNVGDVGVFSFINNYVETDKGNIFQGFCSSFVSMGNSIQVDKDVDCLYYPYNVVSFISTGNVITNKDGFRLNKTTGKYDFKYYKYYNTGDSKLKNYISQDVVHINDKFDINKYSWELKLPIEGNKVSVIGYEPFTGNTLTTDLK